MIKANISKGNAYADKSVYQYSYGQILRIEGMELPDPVEIHFSTRDTGGDSDRRLGTTIDGVTEVAIPDKMLENNGATSDYYIYAFVYIADETHGETVRKIYILVNSRPRPGDLVPPDDPDFAQQLINMVKYKADGLEYKNSILRLMAGETELARVTISGAPGKDGADGITPHIGDNGNWYIGDTDTGVKAEAPSTDSTLTESGKAADAKITGEKISELKRDLGKLSEEKVDNPPTGAVGQILEIETVDENGKPKTYKAVNKPSGGGEVTDEQISNALDNYMEAHPIEETDPTVSDWAKQPEKPTYTASEVGALPDTTKIPSKTSDLQNDSGFLTEHQDLSGYALKSEVPKSASEVGADAAGTAESKVSEHNVALDAHNDIRLLVHGLTERLNALADSDDTTLDQMSEIVAYIKSNKSLIDAITTSKVNVSDIIDNLTTNVSNKPLSAAQGIALKALIDAIIVPTKLSELENDSGYAKTTDIPDKLPNPQKLTFIGAVTAEYDGSKPVSVEIPSGGNGGTEVTEAVKIAEFTINAEMAEATSIELTAEEYPAMKDYNVLWFSLDNYTNSTSPWIQLSINDKVIYKIGNSTNNGFRNVIHSRNGYFFAYGDASNPSLIPNDPYNIDSALSISFISEAWKYVGELSSIKLSSYTKFMQENAKISLYGWTE